MSRVAGIQLTVSTATGTSPDGVTTVRTKVAQVWVYPQLWLAGVDQFHDMDRFFADVDNGTLPAYAFIEPNYGFGPGEGNSQHPGNNTVKGDSFEAGEALMARIYNALVATGLLDAGVRIAQHETIPGGFVVEAIP